MNHQAPRIRPKIIKWGINFVPVGKNKILKSNVPAATFRKDVLSMKYLFFYFL